MQTEYVLDGERFNTLEEFYTEVGRVFVGGEPWGENLNALNNLQGWWLRIDSGRVSVGMAARTRDRAFRLGYAETIRQLQLQLLYCHPTVLIKTAWALRATLRGQGPTVFDWLVTLIKKHPNVELVLVEGDARGV